MVAGMVADMDNHGGDGILWYIDKNATNLASGTIADGGSQNFGSGTGGASLGTISISRGDFLYFAIHPRGSYLFDSTKLDISISATNTDSISGRVIGVGGQPLTGVTVSAGWAGTATTDGNGTYTLSGLAAGTYTLTPSKSGYSFSPASRTVTVPPDATGQDFVGTPPPSSGMIYVGPLFLPTDTVMVDEADGRITTGDHIHLRLPFKNTGSEPITNATVKMTGASQTGSYIGVSVYNGISWLNAQQPVSLTPSTIGPGETGIADFWIYVTDNDPIDRQALTGQTWLQASTGSGQWTINVALSAILFDAIAGNEALKSQSCLHYPGNFEIQKLGLFH